MFIVRRIPATCAQSLTLRFSCLQNFGSQSCTVSGTNDCLALCLCCCSLFVLDCHRMQTFTGCLVTQLADFSPAACYLHNWSCEVLLLVLLWIGLCDGSEILGMLLDSPESLHIHLSGIHYAYRDVQNQTRRYPVEQLTCPVLSRGRQCNVHNPLFSVCWELGSVFFTELNARTYVGCPISSGIWRFRISYVFHPSSVWGQTLVHCIVWCCNQNGI